MSHMSLHQQTLTHPTPPGLQVQPGPPAPPRPRVPSSWAAVNKAPSTALGPCNAVLVLSEAEPW